MLHPLKLIIVGGGPGETEIVKILVSIPPLFLFLIRRDFSVAQL